MGKAKDLEEMLVEVNERILAEIERMKKIGDDNLEKIKVARDYFCDAIVLAIAEKRKDDAIFKLMQALAVLKG